MNDIPQILSCDMIEYVDAKTLPYLRETCRNFLSCYNVNEKWKKNYDDNSDKSRLA